MNTKNTDPFLLPSGRVSRRLAWLFGILTILLIGVLAVGLFLPVLVEAKVNAILNRLSENGSVEFRLRSVRLSGANVQCVLRRGGPDGKKELAAEIGSLDVAYSPIRLLCGQIDSIDVSGVILPMEFTDNTLRIPLLEWCRSIRRNSASSSAREDETVAKMSADGDLNQKIPVRVGVVRVRGNLAVKSGDDLLFLPFGFSVRPDGNDGWNKIGFRAGTAHSSNRFRIEGAYLHKEQKITADVELNASTRAMPFFVRERLPRRFRTDVRAELHAAFDLKSKQIADDASLKLNVEVHARGGIWSVDSSPRLSFSRMPSGSFSLTIDGLQGIAGGMTAEAGKISAVFDPSFTSATGSADVLLGDAFRLPLSFVWDRRSGKNVFAVSTRKEEISGQKQSAVWNGNSIALLNPDFSAGLTIENGIQGFAQFCSGAAEVLLPGNVHVFFKSIALKSTAEIPSGKNLSASAKMEIADAEINGYGTDVFLPGIQLSSEYRQDRLHGELSFSGGKASADRFQLAARGIRGRLPFAFPAGENPEKGMFQMESILWKGKKIGAVQTEPSLDGSTFILQGVASFPVQTMNFDCRAGFDKNGFFTDAKAVVPEQKIRDNGGVKDFVPALEDYQFGGRISAEAEFSIRDGKSKGACSVRLRDGSVLNPALDLKMNGIRLSFDLDELPRLSSRAGQRFSFESLDYAKFHMEKASARFRMDAPKDWTLESLLLHWCGGKVRMAAVRFSPETARIPATIYCDRLTLPEFLRQTGLGPIQGEGEISGAIPVVYEKGNLVFRDGFLYSTPGVEGTVRGTFDPALTEGKGPEMALAVAALKDFNYSWVRINLNSREGNMLVHLNFDGKPENLLYYEFSQEAGSFVPSKIPHRFQGIRLDVNINIPMESVMRLVNNIKKIFSPQQ